MWNVIGSILTCEDREGLKTALVGAAEEVDCHGAGPVSAGLPVDHIGRTGGDDLALGRLGDDVEAGSLGHDGACQSEERGGDGETHFQMDYYRWKC